MPGILGRVAFPVLCVLSLGHMGLAGGPALRSSHVKIWLTSPAVLDVGELL